MRDDAVTPDLAISHLLLLDAAIRFAAFGILIFLSVVLIRDAGREWSGRTTAAFTASVAFYLLCSYGPARNGAGALLPLLQFVCLAVPFLLWLTAQSIFVDGFRPRAFHAVALVAVESFGFGSIALHGEPGIWASLVALVHRAIMVALFGHAIYMAWRGRADDLIEARREFRRLFVSSVGVLGVIIVAIESAHGGGNVPAGLELSAGAAVLVVTVALALFAIRIDPARLFLAVPGAARTEAVPVDQALDPKDRQVLDLVRKAIETDRLYQRDGLTISGLAEAIRVPEHHVRRVINAGLGYRNFNAFLNHYRIEEVKLALANPAKARIPILTIAMSAGYGSIAPFNRAFRDSVGMTPSAYRKVKLGGASDDPPMV